MSILDPQQQAAVETKSRKALVLAGAGSGKTRVLTERIAYLIEHQKVSAYDIAAMTFTRKASQEMRRRLVERLGNKAYSIEIGTMHSIALRMIHRFGELIGLKPNQVTVYNDYESAELLKDVAIDLAMYKGKSWCKPKKDIDAVFDKFYQKGEPPVKDDPLEDLFHTFFSRCKENNSCTYGTLLIEFWRLIPELVKYLYWKHILVDEVQDIAPLDWSIINGLQDGFKASLFVVGDDSQSIYSFRGAVPEYLVKHQAEFDIYYLQSNYRSEPQIVEAANRLIENNKMRLPLEMVATRPEQAAETVSYYPDCDSQKIADKTAASLCTADAPLSIAILARNHALLIKLSQLLTEKGVEHAYIGRKTKLVHSEAFVRFHAILKLLVNPYDNFSFMMIQPLIDLPRAEYLDIRVKAVLSGRSHFQEWMNRTDDNSTWVAFFECISEWSFNEIILNVAAPECSWQFDIQPITDFIFAWIGDRENVPIQDYLDWLALYEIQDEIIEDEEASTITLITIHGAKGLEWDTVVVAGMNEGILPSSQSIKAGNVEDERRLAYVAMTRARNNLILTSRPVLTESNGRKTESPLSRFVFEAIGKEKTC